MSTTDDQQDRIVRADARVKKAAQVEREKQVAWAEIAANTRRADENTVRLKALRLAKEKSEAEAKALEALTKPAVRRRRKAVQP